jgi:hypothetical protein
MDDKNKNYQQGTTSGIDSSHDAMLAYYMEKFYAAARGHLVNKYHVGFWGEYVSEALRIMDRNSYADKYNLGAVKTFKNTTDCYLKTAFNQWADLFYDRDTKVLNMYWAAQSVKVGEAKAKIEERTSIDTTKGIKYPLVRGDQGPQSLSLTIVDDPYMMWYQFFNALFNAQFSPLVLKTRSTFHKINIAVDLYAEASTLTRSSNGQYATEQSPFITDISLAQMFEFNSVVLQSAPSITMGYKEGNEYTFTLQFKYPNAFQGSFKQQLRYLRDNTCDGTDVTAVDAKNKMIRKRFFEDDYGTLKKNPGIYEAFDEKEYYSDYGNRYFSTKSN